MRKTTCRSSLLTLCVAGAGLAPASPHPDAVEEILTFLGERHAEAKADLDAGCDSQKVVWARLMTRQLIDLVLYRLYSLSPGDRESLDRS